MNGTERRTHILFLLTQAKEPMSATDLSKIVNVSRQVVVGDIALLRATGHDILALPKGYIVNNELKDYHSYQVIVKHSIADTKLELKTLVENNIIIQDVTVNHPSYGLLKGELNIRSLTDIDLFLQKKPNLLSSLTGGVHVHTLLYLEKKDLDQALAALSALGFIYID